MFFLILAFVGCDQKYDGVQPVAEKGFIDISGWIIEEKGILPLKGEWEIYWGQLLIPLDFTLNTPPPEKTGFTKLSGHWGEGVNGAPLSSMGYATYRLTTTMKPTDFILALYLGNSFSVCKLWINGKLVAKSGETGLSKKSELPKKQLLIPHLPETKNNMVIILQISNYNNIHGGIHIPILIGTDRQIHNLINQKLLKTALVSGAIFIICLYHYSVKLVDTLYYRL